MKILFAFFAFIVYAASLVDADIYMHNPRGSNNRNNEKSANRRNGNRVFDSQNNNRGGYNMGDLNAGAAGNDYSKQYRMHYIMSPLDATKGKSIMPIEWTNQHGCGENNDTDTTKCNCNVVIQMMCQPHDDTDPAPTDQTKDMLRDGLNTNTNDYQAPGNNENYQQYLTRKNNQVKTDRAYHDSFEWYDKCVTRQRNKGLFTADQKLKGDSSKHTRQNPGGTRRGYECPEERDYYPYWHPTQWKDIKVMAERADRCGFYQQNSFNTASKWECVEKWSDGKTKHYSKHNNKASCEENNGVWTEFHNYLEILEGVNDKTACEAQGHTWGLPIFHDTKKCLVQLPAVECEASEFSRVNHLGNGKDLEPLQITWKVPAFPSGKSQKCIIRIRYNISTDDYNVENPVRPIEIQKTYVVGSRDTRTMGHHSLPPRERSGGSFELGQTEKTPYNAGEYITYTKKTNGAKSFQWIGWSSRDFSNKKINYKFSIFFEGNVPPKSDNFGLKVYGKIHNDWVSTCTANDWCDVAGNANVSANGDGNHVILIFDSITDQRKIHIHGLSVDIMAPGDLITQNPTLDIGAIGQGIKLAINTAQFGRTFQDRTHVSILQKKDDIFNGGTLHAVQVRGKRGNIVQTFPAVEYDFVPTNLNMNINDMVHLQWTGSNTHNNGNPAGDGQAGNDGQGTDGTDRSNVCSLKSLDQVYPTLASDQNNICSNIEKVVFAKHEVHPTDAAQAKLDACIQLMSSGYFKCFKKHAKCTEAMIDGDKADMDPILNNAPASFQGIVLKMKAGNYPYLSTRNNAFTNRAQKASLIVNS